MILHKILDKAIFPAACLVVSKVVGLYIATQIWNYDWYLQNYSPSKNIFSVRLVFDSVEAAMKANTFSNFFMFFVALIFCTYIVIQAFFFHDSHQNPKVISKLAQHGLLGLINNTAQIFASAFVWFSALWIATLICIYSAITQTANIWLGPVTFLLALVVSALIITDIDKEFDYLKRNK